MNTLTDNSWTDFHCHCLPAMDRDASTTAAESDKLINILSEQGVSKIIATPHYYAHNESTDAFVKRRQQAFNMISSHINKKKSPEIVLGSEIQIEHDISTLDLEPLLPNNPRFILLELPFSPYKRWIRDEIENAAYRFSAVPVIAHIERYDWYPEDNIEDLSSIENIIFQINCEALASRPALKWLLKLNKYGIPLILGSDAHNLKTRVPSFNIPNKLTNSNGHHLFFSAKSKASKLLPGLIKNQGYLEQLSQK